jgi:hypothetical protein
MPKLMDRIGGSLPPNDDVGGVNNQVDRRSSVGPNKPDEVVVASHSPTTEPHRVVTGSRCSIRTSCSARSDDRSACVRCARRRIDAALPDGKATVVGIEAARRVPAPHPRTGAFLIRLPRSTHSPPTSPGSTMAEPSVGSTPARMTMHSG